MTKLQQVLAERSGNKCELCKAETSLANYQVLPEKYNNENDNIFICSDCLAQVEKKAELKPEHWKKLSDVMWSEVPGLQVMSWRMLNRLKEQSWAMDLLDMMYMDDERMAWAKATGDHESDSTVDLHKDSNGTILQNGDTVILTKSLDVKGSSINAKLGTVVKNIRLVVDNTEQVEGKIEGQIIVILTKYLRKQA